MRRPLRSYVNIEAIGSTKAVCDRSAEDQLQQFFSDEGPLSRVAVDTVGLDSKYYDKPGSSWRGYYVYVWVEDVP